MLYLERAPHPALVPFIHTLWYARDPHATHSHQRVLPTGHSQVVISLAQNYLTDANHPTDPLQPSPPGLFLGLYSAYQHIDTIDLAELIGISFHPGGTLPFFPHTASFFSNCETDLESLWGAPFRSLRDHLRELTTPAQKFDLLEKFLLDQLQHSRVSALNGIVHYSLQTIHAAPHIATVAELARTTGLSSRRLSQLFTEHVGVSPKLYCRIQRFQHVVQQLHRATEIPWPELALACGYYDQSHFANDFRAFSGLSPTSYTTSTRPWSNHINID
ncbi:AraC family transcriptional regulator [Edaphobacter albus]|uniref:AraC family transcriptional regulator n=1 Tax=Edaphobacter sp. 4G125 TaxID=2763071 RepID=UPI00164574BF|nr:helix-turn-helix domain-containing protein [Edaphobacter sp. 4G125]QNI36684.1 AraC family transcriptional regulator [Edaphobacter sp. 4G125]